MSKKPKPKMVSGVLARDNAGDGCDDVVFFAGLRSERMKMDSIGFWDAACTRSWTRRQFREKYDLRDENNKPCAPPRKGSCFEVELEL